MGAVHKCGQRYTHVCEGLASRHAWEWGGVGSLTNKKCRRIECAQRRESG